MAVSQSKLRRRGQRRRFSLELLEERRVLATFAVTNLDDAGDGSLRRAIQRSNQQDGIDTVVFDEALNGEVISLTSGEIGITQAAFIDASALADGITIDVSGSDATPEINDGRGARVFHVDDGDDAVDFFVELRNLTLAGGDVTGNGGAILSRESLRIFDSTIRDSHAEGSAELLGQYSGKGGGGIATTGLLTITGSLISGNSSHEQGGGIAVSSTGRLLRLTNTDVIDNSAVLEGGGVFADLNGFGNQGARLEIQGSRFSGNFSDRGGAVAMSGYENYTLVEDSVFEGNVASNEGGGIHVSHVRSAVTIAGTSLISNQSQNSSGGGAAFIGHYLSVTISDATIASNQAGEDGGGLFVQSNLEMTGTEIIDNFAAQGGGGLGIGRLGRNQISVTGSTVSGNSAEAGGGVAIRYPYRSTVLIDSTTISGNIAGQSGSLGGGVYAETDGGTVMLRQVTVSGNQTSGLGSGIYVTNGNHPDPSRFFLEHSTVANNQSNIEPTSDVGDAAGVMFRDDLSDRASYDVTNSILSGSLVNGNPGIDLNVDVNGLAVATSLVQSASDNVFAAVNSDNLVGVIPELGPLQNNGGDIETHGLLPGSPAIDAGSAAEIDIEFDARGPLFGRLRDGDDVPGARLDLGALEVQGENVAPIANAGDDITTRPSTPTMLDGSGSIDPDAGPADLSYEWEVVSDVGSANVQLTNAMSQSPTFASDTDGSFEVQLTVSDGLRTSADVVSVVVVPNASPTADVSLSDMTGEVGTTVILDGTRSFDPESDALTFAWQIVERPEGSVVTLDNVSSDVASFNPDVAGTYRFELVVTDELGGLSVPVFLDVVVGRAAPDDWQNSSMPNDVNGDGAVGPLDALLVIREISLREFSDADSGFLLFDRPDGADFLDVDGDSFVAPLDALLVINALPSTSDSASGRSSDFVPLKDMFFETYDGQHREEEKGKFENRVGRLLDGIFGDFSKDEQNPD